MKINSPKRKVQIKLVPKLSSSLWRLFRLRSPEQSLLAPVSFSYFFSAYYILIFYLRELFMGKVGCHKNSSRNLSA